MVNARHIFQAPRMGAKTGKDACGIIRDIGGRCGGRQRAIGEAIHQQQSLKVNENAVAAKGAWRRDGSDGDGKIQYLSRAGITAKGAQRHIHAWLQIQVCGEGSARDDLVRRNAGQAMQQGITRGGGQQFRTQHGARARRVFEARFGIQAARARNDKGDIGPRGQARQKFRVEIAVGGIHHHAAARIINQIRTQPINHTLFQTKQYNQRRQHRRQTNQRTKGERAFMQKITQRKRGEQSAMRRFFTHAAARARFSQERPAPALPASVRIGRIVKPWRAARSGSCVARISAVSCSRACSISSANIVSAKAG